MTEVREIDLTKLAPPDVDFHREDEARKKAQIRQAPEGLTQAQREALSAGVRPLPKAGLSEVKSGRETQKRKYK